MAVNGKDRYDCLIVINAKQLLIFVKFIFIVSNDKSSIVAISKNYNSFFPYFATLNRNTLKYILHEANFF